MPSEPYSSLMKQKPPIFDCEDFQIYDFSSERGTYVYRDMKDKKYTPIDKTLARKCMTKITKYLEEEFRGQSEFVRCMEYCGQPWKRFLVATYLLWKVEKKILLFGSYGKTYLRLIKKMKRSLKELLDENVSWHEYGVKPVQVLDPKSVKWLEMIRKKKRKRILEEYKHYRETYG